VDFGFRELKLHRISAAMGPDTNENISNWTRGHSRPAATQLLESGNLRSP
jgi:hypothetical protein